MKFADPYFLNLLWVLIPVFGIMAFGMHQRRKIMKSFMKTDMFQIIVPGYTPARRWIKYGVILLASGFCITALAGPQAGFRWEKVEQKGVDIMIALDCSKSMLAQDVKPSRLARAKREIIDLMRMMKSDRAGLVAFSGTAVLQCPLTLDREAFHIFLDVLKPGYLPVGGTNIEAAIMTCADGFEKQSNTQKAIILITDGEDTKGNIEKTAQKMAEQDIKVFCVGVGEDHGAPIPDESGGFVKETSGNIVLSRVDEKVLKEIAKITGGAFVRSVAGDMDLDVIYKQHILGGMKKSTLVSEKKKVWENRFQWVLFPAVLLLIMEMLLPGAKTTVRSFLVFFISFSLGFTLFPPGKVLAGTVSKSVKQGIEAFEKKDYQTAKKHFIDAQLNDPDNKALYYDIGTAAYMNNEFGLAEKNFARAAASKDKALRHKALYNLANAEYRNGDPEKAIQTYEKVLKEYPEDSQAKENLEFVKEKKKKQEQQKKSGKNQKNRDSKDPDKKEKKNQNRDNPDQESKKPSDKKDNKGSSGTKQGDNKASQEQGKKNQSGNNQQKSNQTPPQPDSKKSMNQNPGQVTPEKQKSGSDKNKGGSDESKQAMAGRSLENPSDRQMEQMLNRLSDKPGQALIPMTGGQDVEKDW